MTAKRDLDDVLKRRLAALRCLANRGCASTPLTDGAAAVAGSRSTPSISQNSPAFQLLVWTIGGFSSSPCGTILKMESGSKSGQPGVRSVLQPSAARTAKLAESQEGPRGRAFGGLRSLIVMPTVLLGARQQRCHVPSINWQSINHHHHHYPITEWVDYNGHVTANQSWATTIMAMRQLSRSMEESNNQ